MIPKNPTTDFTSTTLNGSINASQLTITVNDASTIQTPTYGVIDREDNNGVASPNQREVVYVSAKSSNDLTVSRGVNNSTARSHNDSAKFEPLITVGFWSDFTTAYDNEHTLGDGSHDITKVAVLSGATVQILASKILSNPTITAPSLSLGSDAQGDIYYRGSGATIVRLAPGTANQALLTGGAAANPSWVTLSKGYSLSPGDQTKVDVTTFADLTSGTVSVVLDVKSNVYAIAHCNMRVATAAATYIQVAYDSGGADTVVGQQGYTASTADSESCTAGGIVVGLAAGTYTFSVMGKTNVNGTGYFNQPNLAIMVVPSI